MPAACFEPTEGKLVLANAVGLYDSSHMSARFAWPTITMRLAAALLAFGQAVRAQELRGTVRDSASNQIVAGAVVTLLDAPGRTLGRTLSNERGEYRLRIGSRADRLRVVHIGFRPRELALPANPARLDVGVVRLATLLEPINVSARACGSRPDRTSAIALLEQARTVLLATVVAQESNPGEVVAYGFQRRMDGTSDQIEYQTVRADSLVHASKSFWATRRGGEFVRDGFLGQSADGRDALFAPDAETLLDDEFVNAYCFRLMRPEPTRPYQLGLGFSAPDHRANRVDIDGALWIDTLTRTLRDIEFRYIGLDPRIQRFGPQGRISFDEMPNGVVLIDRWRMRLVGSRLDTAVRVTARKIDTTERLVFLAQESGAELARAAWPSGHSWQGSLGALRLNAVTGVGTAAVGARLRIPGTPYGGTVDA
ncbi:MAG TPA: carboxypeptidase-like regulatory domain-containing protein, partial [Gemmatimonadaceae bacterium]|nr:carboxypeptidase-like regulatory domain-containing protein [Gemmatimonadaceae bacterium]